MGFSSFAFGSALTGKLWGRSASAFASEEPSLATDAPLRGEYSKDVVVIGAGWSGLYAARILARAGMDVMLIEARNRPGGRTNSYDFTQDLKKKDPTLNLDPDLRFDVGGQWLGPTQHRMLALVSEFFGDDFKGNRLVEMFETYDQGTSKLLRSDGSMVTYKGLLPKLGLAGIGTANLGLAMGALEGMARTVNVAHPWTHPLAKAWDAQTMGDWIDDFIVEREANELFKAAMRIVFSADTDQFSLLHGLVYMASAGGLDPLIEARGGAQAWRFKHGTAALSYRLAETLGDRVRYNAVVNRIQQSADRVTVVGKDFTINAKRAILTMSPEVVNKHILFDQGLSEDRAFLNGHVKMGLTIKCMAIYKTPFWRKSGFSGQAVDASGPVTGFFDNSPADGSLGVALGFSLGRRAQEMAKLNEQEREKIAMESFGKFFGEDPSQFLLYHDKIWAKEEYSLGCYTGYFPPQAWTRHGKGLRAPEGRIHWAGTETAQVWMGYMEGGCEAGERAAKEVIRALKAKDQGP